MAATEKLAEATIGGTGFASDVLAELAKPLDLDRVKKKPGKGNFDYIPHADIRRTANAIFGFDGWGYTTDSVQVIAQGPLEKDGKKGVQACAVARVTLKVRLLDGSWLEKGGVGEGTGNGYGPTAPVEAPGKAVKEAESDALKRAFINLGDQFGLILYAKDEERKALQAEAEANQPKEPAEGDRWATADELTALVDLSKQVPGAAEKVAEGIAAQRKEHGEHVSAAWLKRQFEALQAKAKQIEQEQPGAATEEQIAEAFAQDTGQAA